MRITDAMIAAARRAELDYHQKGRAAGLPPFRFIPTPIAVIRAMLEGAVAAGQREQRKERLRALAGWIMVAIAPRRPRRLS